MEVRSATVATSELSTDLAHLRARVGYLAASALPTGDVVAGAGAAEWVAAAAFLQPHGILARLLGADRTGRFARDRRVAASSFFQGAALRVLGTGVGLWFTTGRFPDVAAPSSAYALEVDLPARLALLAGSGPGAERSRHVTSPEPAWFASRAFDEHLDPLAAAVRREVRIGEHTLWGNAAAAVVGVLLDLVRSYPAAERPERLATARALVERLPHHLGRCGDWTPISDRGRRDVFWTRRTCCLWYLEDPERRLCDTCNLLPASERRDRLVDQLARRREPPAVPG